MRRARCAGYASDAPCCCFGTARCARVLRTSSDRCYTLDARVALGAARVSCTLRVVRAWCARRACARAERAVGRLRMLTIADAPQSVRVLGEVLRGCCTHCPSRTRCASRRARADRAAASHACVLRAPCARSAWVARVLNAIYCISRALLATAVAVARVLRPYAACVVPRAFAAWTRRLRSLSRDESALLLWGAALHASAARVLRPPLTRVALRARVLRPCARSTRARHALKAMEHCDSGAA